MIQFNLLPDIKMEYLKARRAKRSVLVISAIASAASIGLFITLFVTVNIFQKNHIENLTSNIDSQKQELDDIEDLDKILTIQNQLNSLTPLHEQKPVTSWLFEYLTQLVPVEASVSELELNFTESTMEISGTADSLVTVNKFVDTLKFTQYMNDEEEVDAFSEVVLSEYSTSNEGTSYIIQLNFDPLIFDSSIFDTEDSEAKKLIVPELTTTRSTTEKPSGSDSEDNTTDESPQDLFQEAPEEQE